MSFFDKIRDVAIVNMFK